MLLGGSIEQLLRSRLEIEPGILMGLVPGNCGDALHEVEDALGLAALLGEHRLDDLGRLRLPEAALAQEFSSLVVSPSNDSLARSLDAVDERHGRGICETRQRRGRLVGKSGGGVFRMADGDFLEIFHTPEIAVLADSAKIE